MVRGWKRSGEEPGDIRRVQQLLRAAREVEVNGTIVAGRRMSSLAQEEQWFKALEEERKIRVCELGERRKTRKSRGRRMVIHENWDICNCAIYCYCFSNTIDEIT